VAEKKTAKAKIFAFMDFHKDPINSFISGGCPIFNTAVDADDNYPLIKGKIADVFRTRQQELVDVLAAGIRDKEFSTNLDAPVFAFKVIASIEGGIIMCRTMETVKPMHSLIKSLKAELEQYAL
jgi:TetR/AcrR family transcriptional repressor of nem operon